MMSRPLPDSESQVRSPDRQIFGHFTSPLSDFILFDNKGFGAIGNTAVAALNRVPGIATPEQTT